MAQAGGDLSGARAAYEKDLELTKALSESDPANAQIQVDLIISHLKLAGFADAAKDTAAFRTHVAAALAVLERLDREGKGKGDAQVAHLRAILDKLPRQ